LADHTSELPKATWGDAAMGAYIDVTKDSQNTSFTPRVDSFPKNGSGTG